MKKSLTLAALIFCLLNMANAQRGFDLTEMLQRQKENVFKKVENLSPLQKELINGIYDEYGETIKETFEEARRTRSFAGLREKMDGLMEERDLLVKDVLNDEQYEVFLKIVEEGRPKRDNDQN